MSHLPITTYGLIIKSPGSFNSGIHHQAISKLSTPYRLLIKPCFARVGHHFYAPKLFIASTVSIVDSIYICHIPSFQPSFEPLSYYLFSMETSDSLPYINCISGESRFFLQFLLFFFQKSLIFFSKISQVFFSNPS